MNELKNEVKKILYKTKVMAKFSHYVSGELFYTVEIEDNTYQFPIETIEKNEDIISLSSDLGTTTFSNEIRGSELNRWITKAIDKNLFIKIR